MFAYRSPTNGMHFFFFFTFSPFCPTCAKCKYLKVQVWPSIQSTFFEKMLPVRFSESTCAARVGVVRTSLALLCLSFHDCLDIKQNCGPVATLELGY